MTRQQKTLRWFGLFNVLLLALMLGRTMEASFAMGLAGSLYALAASLFYGMLFYAPVAAISLLLGRYWPRVAVPVTVFLSSLVVLALYADQRVFDLYGFHFNGFVWNLVTTPGGVESMGSSDGTMGLAALLVMAVLLVEVAAYLLLRRWFGHRAPGVDRKVVLAVFVALCCSVQISYAFGRILAWQPVLLTAREVPLFIPVSVRDLAKRLGIEPRRRVAGAVSTDGVLNYPLHPLTVEDNPHSPNILWLVSESLRADMLTPEIMPNLWHFAEQAHRFDNHLSGGNGTRFGVFSLFYGLPGNYWFSFVDARRSPVFMDELQRRGYQLGIYASSALTYPEFDKTVFAKVPRELLHEDISAPSWQGDRNNVKGLLAFLDQARAKPGQPWLGYLFFNSPHARYFFPDESVIREDYLRDFNYARSDSDALREHMVQIKNRYINSVHHLDQQLGRIFAYVREHDLKKDTIIIITGDHGEEFMDVSRWGHNSELHNAQLQVPMVLWIPGKGQGEHDCRQDEQDHHAATGWGDVRDISDHCE